jgi:murein L,D-transpeptidase YafK
MKINIYKKSKRLDVVEHEKIIKTYTIGIGKNENGHKQTEGDMRTPEGEYKIIVKNPQSKYHLSLGLNYPNKQDAELGLAANIIDQQTHNAICAAHDNGQLIPWKTALGGEIFIHGDYQNRTWSEGCIRMTNNDIEELYNMIEIGTSVTIIPE